MQIPVSSVDGVGALIRAARKASGVRQDDVPGVSHMFMRDLEQGKETVQFGRVLRVLDELGIRMVLEVADSQACAVAQAVGQLVPKANMVLTRQAEKDGP